MLKKIINRIYVEIFFNKNDAKLLAEYFSLSNREVMWMLRNGSMLNNCFWKIVKPKTEKERELFYRESPFGIFDLVFWHMTRFQKKFRKEAVGFAKGRVLDFGGGMGDASLAASKKGLKVDYADVSGRTFEFARWLFKKEGREITMIDVSREKITKTYDTIFCIDVIEHIENPKTLLGELASYVNKGGYMIITNLEINDTSVDEHPMHFKTNLDDSYLASLGFEKTKHPWLLIKR